MNLLETLRCSCKVVQMGVLAMHELPMTAMLQAADAETRSKFTESMAFLWHSSVGAVEHPCTFRHACPNRVLQVAAVAWLTTRCGCVSGGHCSSQEHRAPTAKISIFESCSLHIQSFAALTLHCIAHNRISHLLLLPCLQHRPPVAAPHAHSHTTSENIATCRRRQLRTALSSTSNTCA